MNELLYLKKKCLFSRQQGLYHLNLYCKAVFSNILDHATPPFQKKKRKKLNIGIV